MLQELGLVEQRYHAVLEVLDGVTAVTDREAEALLPHRRRTWSMVSV
jgi:hypothetical protein